MAYFFSNYNIFLKLRNFLIFIKFLNILKIMRYKKQFFYKNKCDSYD